MFLATLFNPCFKGKIEILQGVKKKKKKITGTFSVWSDRDHVTLLLLFSVDFHFARTVAQMNSKGTCRGGTQQKKAKEAAASRNRAPDCRVLGRALECKLNLKFREISYKIVHIFKSLVLLFTVKAEEVGCAGGTYPINITGEGLRFTGIPQLCRRSYISQPSAQT